jgi:NodT family efflux transporter outer membrane factor (OMF) lipoprotein
MAPPAFTEQPPQSSIGSKDWAAAAPEDAWAKGRWWEVFHDPELNALEQQVDVNNQTLKSSVARFRQARAFVRENRSSRFPTISAGVTIARDRESLNQGVAPPANEAGYGNFDLGASASWEPDLWGRIRDLVASSVQNAQASAADLENARLSLHAELALDLFDLRSLDNERKILEDSVVAYQKALDLTQNRYNGGAVNRSEVEEARTQLEATSAQAVDVTDLRTQDQDAIAVLTGQPPEGFSIAYKTGSLAPVVTPAGVPSALLERRPDIAAAERRVASANSQVGLAHQHHQLVQLAEPIVGGWTVRGTNAVRCWKAACSSRSIHRQLRRACSGLQGERADGISAGRRQFGFVAYPRRRSSTATAGRSLSARIRGVVAEPL